MLLPRAKTSLPPSPKAGDIIYATNTDDPETGDIRELLMFDNSKRDWLILYEVWNGLSWVRCISPLTTRSISERFKKDGGEMAKPAIKSLNDIAISGIQQGQIGEAIKPLESVPNKYLVRFPLGSGGWIYTTLYKDVDFILIEDDYSECLRNGSQKKKISPFTFHRSIPLNE